MTLQNVPIRALPDTSAANATPLPVNMNFLPTKDTDGTAQNVPTLTETITNVLPNPVSKALPALQAAEPTSGSKTPDTRAVTPPVTFVK